jgi:phage gp36-like protein
VSKAVPYATQQLLVNAAGGTARFVALTDWDNDAASDADVVALYQTQAESWIDSFIPVRYSPPLASPSDELRALAAAETIYRIRSEREQIGQAELEKRKERERYLEDVRSGKLRPDSVTTEKSAGVRGAIVPLDDCGTSRKGLKGLW